MRFPALVPVTTSILLLILVSGCTPTTPEPVPEPTPSFVAPYATDEEALAAAEDAYGEYLRVSGEILRGGGTDPERMSEVAVEPLLSSSIRSFEEQRSAGHIVSGQSSIKSMKLQRYSVLGPSPEIITVYLCEDVSLVSVSGADGSSVVSEDRNDSILLQATFDYIDVLHVLKVSGVEKWNDEPC